MSTQAFTAAMAVGLQVDIDTLNATISGLSGALDSSDGIVLGVSDAGTGETGITLPTFAREATEQSDVVSSFTRTANSLIRTNVESFDFTFLLKGNGVTSTPSAGQGKPLPGIDALLEAAGLDGANGSAPLYVYTPRATSVYATIKLWVADMAWVFKACLVENMTFEFIGGGDTKVTCSISVGSIESQADGVAIPTFDYTTQSSLSAPILQGAGFSWGQTRGFRTMSLAVVNTIEAFEDSNQATGLRQAQSDRSIDMDAVINVDDGDTDYEYTQVAASSAPTDDAVFQLGTIAGATDTINACKVEFNNGVIDSYQSEKAGDIITAAVRAHATATSAAGEFTLTFN